MRGLAALAAGALLWGVSAGPAAADQDRQQQWVLDKYGLADKVWPISQGEGVIVAVIDTGVNANHPDLAGQVLPGIDFTGAGGDGRTDTNGHGTGMASNIAGHGHGDNAGVMGLAPKAKILPIRIQSDQFTNVNDHSHDADAIRFAVDHNAKVINMSYSGADPYAKGYKEAIEYAIQKDVILVAGSGNSPGFPVGYPAGSPGVVAVSGVGEDGEIWSDSTTGPQVTLAAPADNIHSAGLNQEYRTASGTSDASAFVSAVAALVRSKYPNLSAGQVINRMTSSAVHPEGKGPFPNDKYGYGIVSPSKALAPNSAVDNGPKGNPLLDRTEPNGGAAGTSAAPSSQASKPASAGGDSAAPQASGDSGSKSNSGMLIAIGGGVVAVIVIVLIVVMVRRSKNGNGGGGSGGPGGSGGSGAAGGPGGPGYGYQQQGGQQAAGYGYPQGQQSAPGYPPQQGGQPGYPVQPPAGGNPYQS